MALSSRTTRNSQRHLSTDYEWETLPSIDESLLFKASRELLDSSPSQHAEKHRKDSKSPIDPGAVPKRRPADDPSLPQATPQVPFTGQDTSVASSSSAAKRIPRARDQEAQVATTACQATRRPNRFTYFYRVQSGEFTRRLKGSSEDPASAAFATHLRPR